MSIYIKESQKPAKICMIWLHGLGADASDMQGLADQFPPTHLPCRHVFLDAPLRPVTINNGMTMRAWYDITGFTESAREDIQGISASEAIIRDALEKQITEGFAYQQLFLAGFSQGGAMALFTALQIPGQLGGVIALSSYFPARTHCTLKLDKKTPFFIAGGTRDPIVLPHWTENSRNWLQEAGYNQIDFHQYPMEHSICYEEVQDIHRWLNTNAQGVTA